MVDVSFMPENPLTLNEDAVKADVTIIPDCGEALRLSNILIGRAVSKLDQVESVHMMDCGLPEKPLPPLGYVITWSVEDLIEEYTRKARIVKDGKVIDVEVLSGLEEVGIPSIGRLEAFYADGLRTLLYTIRGVKSMWVKVFRYLGYVEKIKLLRTLGLFDEEPVKIENVYVPPRALTVKLLEKRLRRPEIRDIVVMRLEVCGTKEGLRTRYSYFPVNQRGL